MTPALEHGTPINDTDVMTIKCVEADEKKPRLDNIQAMRGLAALAVVWYHFSRGMTSDIVVASGALGYLGVEVFFVISGFVIPYSFSQSYRTKDFGRFMLKRMLRL